MYHLEWIAVKTLETLTVTAEKGKYLQIHNRPTFALSFCKSGKITYTHNGKQYISTPDRAVILPMGETYELYNNLGGEFPLINFTCTEQFTDEILTIPLKETDEYFRDYEKLRRLEAFNGSRLKMMGIFYGILDRLLDESTAKNPHLSHALQYIAANLDDPTLSNIKIAEEAGISEVYLRRLFLESCKTTPKQYIIEIRIKKAGQLLRENRLTIHDIAVLCGFSNVYHFCRAFKQYSGLTPSEYRSRYYIEGI